MQLLGTCSELLVKLFQIKGILTEENEPCVPVIEQMLKFNWPSRKEMYSVRQFMIIQP